jgi:integrase
MRNKAIHEVVPGAIFSAGTSFWVPSRSENEAMARRRHQCPAPFKHGNWWVINYRVDEFKDGQLARTQKQAKLAPASWKIRAVLDERDKFIAPLNHGSVAPGAAVTFKDYVSHVYRPNKLLLLEGSSRERYESVLRTYLINAFGEKMLRELTPDTVQTLFTRLAVQPQSFTVGKKTVSRILSLQSRRKVWTVFSSIMAEAKKGGHLMFNPAEGIDLGRDVRGRHGQPFITPKQFESLLAIMPEPYATMVYVSVFTGLRVSELAALKWRNLDGRLLTIEQKYSRGHWGAPKSDASNTTIVVAKSVIDRIFALKGITVSVRAGSGTRIYKVVKADGPDDLVFQGVRTGGPLNDGNVLRRFIKPAGEKLGIAIVNWQALRRSTATWHKRAGTHVKDAQALMRHEHESTMLKHYTQIETETQIEAVDRFEAYFRQEAAQRVN